MQGSGSAGNGASSDADTASGTASQNNSSTTDHNAQDNSSGTGTAQNGSNTTDHTAQTGNNDSSGTSQAGVSQHAAAGSATMVNGGITEQEAKNIAAGNAGVTEEQIQYITVKQDWDDGRARYEVEFTAAGVEYDYELDASDGRILSADSEVIDRDTVHRRMARQVPGMQPAHRRQHRAVFPSRQQNRPSWTGSLASMPETSTSIRTMTTAYLSMKGKPTMRR